MLPRRLAFSSAARPEPAQYADDTILASVRTQQIFAIRFNRQPRVDDHPGLVSLTVEGSNGQVPARPLGALTDVAVRGRLAHFGVHSANEVAAIRRALNSDNGQVTIHEGWTGLTSCLKFWHDFTGSQIRPVDWTCDRCGTNHRENVGASVGETYSRACRCGKVKRITTLSDIPPRR